MITLEQLLLSRDRRASRQRSLLEQYPSGALLCLTVQLPGNEKRSPLSLKIASVAACAVRAAFEVKHEELYDFETGYEGYFVVDVGPESAKTVAVELEESHPLGRLWDLDVIVPDGGGVRPLSRPELGFPERRCLICEKPARYCIRARAHSSAELVGRMKEMVEAYERH